MNSSKTEYKIYEIFNKKGKSFSQIIEETFLEHLIVQALKLREESSK